MVGSEVVRFLTETDGVSNIVSITRRPVKYRSPKVQNHVIDFSRLSDYSNLFKGELLFSCLGTTIAKAKSTKAQREVDLVYQLQAAQSAIANNVNHYLLVSSNGANPTSASAYLKMKGELETNIKKLGFNKVSIFQPSLIIGERPDRRVAESLAAKILPALCRLPGLTKYRPIRGDQVAEKMVSVSREQQLAYQCYCLDEVFP